MATMNLVNVNKIYPNKVQAVFDFNLEIKDGEFIVFVGPSGCGKSTTLRMIAGLEEITSGKLLIDNIDVSSQAPKDRDIAMVFQNYALYAHMTVYHNMAFSLMLRREESDAIHERVMWAADILGLKPYLNRKPRELSGGQRQRVALGRSIVRDPKVFLLDEPLSNLDAKLRDSMRKELKLLHHRLGATMVYVTHDQIEALTLADRIVIMNAGYIQQVGTPKEVYDRPVNLFVANFIGTPPMNILDAKLTDKGVLQIGDDSYDISKTPRFKALKEKGYFSKEITVGVRPEHIGISHTMESNVKSYQSKVELNELLGSTYLIYFHINETKVISRIDVREEFNVNDKIYYSFDLENIYYFDKETGLTIYE